MQPTPKSLRLHIGIFGRRNVGKSSLLNALANQAVSIVSDVAGTTTDPVEKAMELQPIGPVLFIDTAGIDDQGALGTMRIAKTNQVIERTDIALIVAAGTAWGDFETELVDALKANGTGVIAVFNKTDVIPADPDIVNHLQELNIPSVATSATTGHGLPELRQALIAAIPDEFITQPAILADLVPPGELVVMVVPIDKEAPKGRLILPQVQSIRDLLDHDSFCMVVKERELREALDRLKRPPALVVTDSQAFLKVAGDTPDAIPMTSFSILFARYKGELTEFVRGTTAIDRLRSGDSILITEACTHHPIADDIGRVKIPRWLRQYVGGDLNFEHFQGHDFPADLASYQLVVHCGSCMLNRRAVLSRIERCRVANVPITNYGLAIAYSLGIFERALRPFPGALQAYRESRDATGTR